MENSYRASHTDILNLVKAMEEPNIHKPFNVKGVTYLGYVVEDNRTGELSVHNEDWVKNYGEMGKLDNYICTKDDKPLLYIKGVPYSQFYNDLRNTDRDKPIDLFYWGENTARVSVNYKVRDDKPELREYSNSLERLNGKDLMGKLEDVGVTIRTVEQPKNAVLRASLDYTGIINTNYYSHALTFESGDLSLDKNDNIVFTSKRIEEFSRYRSGCGHPEHFHIPNSDYKKYVETTAILPILKGEEVKVIHEVADDPKFLMEQKIKSCRKDLHIDTKTYSDCDPDGHYDTTVSDITLLLAKGKEDGWINVFYIADEHKNKSKAIEYAVEESVNDFLNFLMEEELATPETVNDIINATRQVINQSQEKGFNIKPEFIKRLDGIDKNNTEKMKEEPDLDR